MTAQGLSIGAWVRRRRRTLGLTQSGLAARVPCATITIRKIESGERRPSRDTAIRLAEALDLDAEAVEAFVAAARTWLAPSDPDLEVAPPGFLRHDLPRPPSPLLGREEEVAALLARLAPAGGPARLLTLTGPPGVGKTRLALEVGARAEAKFDLPTVWVDLGGVTDPADVGVSVAMAVAPPAAGGSSILDLAVHALDRVPTLLVLDNFEQVVDAGPQIGELLARVGNLTVLVTSRIALDLYGEHEHRVAPLPVLLEGPSPAVDLFVARAGEVRPDLDLGPGLHDVAAVCRAVDGLPLAIELAALRLRDLDLLELRNALEQDLGALGENRRDRPDRHRTIHHAVTASVALLGEDDRRVLAAAAVCAGPLDLERLGAICDLDGNQVARTVRQLDRHGLLTRAHGDGPRCLAVVREHVLAGLDPGAEQQLRDRHATAVTAAAVAASTGITAWPERDQVETLAGIDDDIRTALAWWDGPGARPDLLRDLVLAAGPVWFLVGRADDFLRWSSRAHDALPDDHVATYLWATARWAVGDPAPELPALFDRAATTAAAQSDVAWEAEAVGTEQFVHLSRGEVAAAIDLQERAEAAAERAGPEWQALAALRGGGLALRLGEVDQAEERAGRACRLYDELGSSWGRASSLGLTGDVAAATGATSRAAETYLTAVTLFLDAGLVGSAVGRVAAIANLLVRSGRSHDAAAVYGLVDQWLDDLGAPLDPMAVLPAAQWRPVASEALGPGWDDAVAAGRALPRTTTTLTELTTALR